MPEMPDVNPGDPIESTWGNLTRSRTAQRYDDATQRDLENPIPAIGDLAVLTNTPGIPFQIWNGTEWSDLIQLADLAGLDAVYLRLDVANSPLGGSLGILGNLEIRKDLSMSSPDGVSNGYKLSPNVSDADDFGLVTRKLDDTALTVLSSTGELTLQLPVSGRSVRNVFQSTADPTGGDGADGDVWLKYA